MQFATGVMALAAQLATMAQMQLQEWPGRTDVACQTHTVTPPRQVDDACQTDEPAPAKSDVACQTEEPANEPPAKRLKRGQHDDAKSKKAARGSRG